MDKTVVGIGFTGTLGNSIMPLLLADESIRRIRVFSRSEHRQIEMEAKFPQERVDYLLGDIADKNRIRIACRGADEVYHFAAIKSVDKAEYNPSQAIRTNVIGTMNVINACIENGIKKAVLTSTDKAVEPLNIYGASKTCAELLWIEGNIGAHHSRFSAVRYGNVAGSQGSVIPKWFAQAKEGKTIIITNPTATRYFISAKKAAQFVYDAMQRMTGGETYIPKMKSCEIINLARLISNNFDVVGLRPGEKLDETLISENEAYLINDLGDCYCRYPYIENYPVKKEGTAYVNGAFTSMNAERFTTDELKGLLDEYNNHM